MTRLAGLADRANVFRSGISRARRWKGCSTDRKAVAGGRRVGGTAELRHGFVHVEDGHPIRYVRRVSGTKTRLEWQIKLTRVEP